MRIIGFYHSLVSDWNHGNAHFLRGLVSELLARGHDVLIYEPRNGWSLENLRRDLGPNATDGYHALYPNLRSSFYDPETLNVDSATRDADVVLVHEWNEPSLVHALGANRRRRNDHVLLFHDTHHRMVTAPSEMERYDLTHYDGVLAFGEVLRKLYIERRLTHAAYTFHEAADTRVFRPLEAEPEEDLVWVGNWGDGERSEELREFLLDPVHALGLRASVYGVRYPAEAEQALAGAGIRYRGFLPNYRAPEAFARHRVTVHVPRRPYVQALVGVPTIRVFEALACGIPLISAPWDDAEHLFRVGTDFLSVRDGREMTQRLRDVVHDSALAASLRRHGLETILAHHTCGHRAEQLLDIARSLGASSRPQTSTPFAAGVEP